MNILNINGEDTCGISKTLSDAVNQYTRHKSRVLVRSMNVREYPYDLWFGVNCDTAKLRKLIDWADVLHFNIWPPSAGFGNVKFYDYINSGKKVLMQFHGTAFRRTPPIRQEVVDNAFKCLVTMPIMFGYVDDELCRTEWLPFPIPTDDPRFMPIPKEDKFQSFAVCHSPGELHRWEIKDTERLVEAMMKLGGRVDYNPDLKQLDTDYLTKTVQVINSKAKRYMRLELMADKPWDECLKIKQRCHISFDHLQGYYGTNTAETMAMGLPSICNPNHETWDMAEERFGEEPPFVVSDRVILEDTITSLRDDEELRYEVGAKSRDYAVKVHDLQSAVLPQLVHAYKEVYRSG